ncbi:CCA tRNA nucleotidyltransferase [Rhodovulum sulfidophilum]|uniref:CCA tRNA nucleotidyltransferase n=1 Tax=Rhodovulum visakhapatnamense TaxID=364297 RepID=A0ABS1RAD3_9RHOB|nr:CCA tRNA nucleotidyltransferase [Rhodovulum visakhapatnamense]MBL3568284.1 CCA tRNA nucleotidyltransferase [Rhodovulum visakhapatnamense]MBL3576578.1 CCA tRNA nucleotidyltransferase [Rhodovulum visakhapatnamense]OLS43232.1 CCA tRNA nucleotidyltransferase [Rhodovulum sulfidophilum]
MTRVFGDWFFADHTQAVCAVLTRAGYRALFVGGCVRNALLGVPVTDIDIATDARPETVMALAEAAGLKAVPTGFDHGTVTVVAGHLPHEVTTFRRDVETFGRRAVVAFADSPEEDARRRDFTMNAIYATPEGAVIDPLGGLADLAARRVRFIDDADARIREDFLRILRFFRFHAWYGDAEAGLDPDGLAAAAANSAGIETLSKERIGAEIRKLLAAPDPAPSVAAMAAAGVLARTLPGADPRALPVLVALEQAQGLPPDPVRRLATLGGEAPAKRLRLSKAEARRLERLTGAAGQMAGAAELAYRLGPDMARDAVLLRSAALGQPLSGDLASELARGTEARFPLSAADLMPGFDGPALGAALKRLEADWVASGFRLSAAELIARARQG